MAMAMIMATVMAMAKAIGIATIMASSRVMVMNMAIVTIMAISTVMDTVMVSVRVVSSSTDLAPCACEFCGFVSQNHCFAAACLAFSLALQGHRKLQSILGLFAFLFGGTIAVIDEFYPLCAPV